jgi:exodeoxyribonuclease VII small subunit
MSELNFEKALEELEATVNRLEEGRMTLNESLDLFERGIKLAKYLRTELEKAEKKIEILLKDETGEVKAEAFSVESEENKKKTDKPPEDSGTGNKPLPF